MRARLLLPLLAAAFAPAFGGAAVAKAGGYDTPILYSARHMGMGGTAIAGVSDASALFHNPAGLGRIQRANVIGDLSLIIGNIDAPLSRDDVVESADTTVAPFFLVGGAYRFTDWLAAGFAIYPVASAGASYPGEVGDNTTTLLFIEASPGISITVPNVPLHIGLSYRATYVSLDRQIPVASGPFVDLTASGTSFAGFRAGVQWDPIPELKVGFSYRHKTVTEVEDESAIAFLSPLSNVKTEFILPSTFGLGVRADFGDVGVAVDAQYALQSQNDAAIFEGTDMNGAPQTIPNRFEWENSVTVRVGGEYRLHVEPTWTLPLRLGFIYDGTVYNKQYPSAFGTPPGPNYSITAGAGYDAGAFQVNLAYAHRIADASVSSTDLDGAMPCPLCSNAGDYSLRMNGIYVDVSYDFE